MANISKKPTKPGGRYCVAGAPGNTTCRNTTYTPGISMHTFPKDPVTRRKWLAFVLRHRVDFSEEKVKPKSTSLCSAHFDESCFTRRKEPLEGFEEKLNRVLIKGSVPTRHTVVSQGPVVLSRRDKRQVSLQLYFVWFARKPTKRTSLC